MPSLDFNLPKVEDRKEFDRFTLAEIANIQLNGNPVATRFYVAGINKFGMLICSQSLNEYNLDKIGTPILIEPNNIKSYTPLK